MSPTTVSTELITQLPDKRAALRACVVYSGKQLKEVAWGIGIKDPGHLSKMLNVHADPRHFPPEKENLLMDFCRNEIPLLWSLMSRGYAAPCVLEQLEARNRLLQEEVDRLTAELARVRSEQLGVFNIFKNIEAR